MFDTVVFRHFTAHGGPLPDVREALAQRLHDAGIDGALSASVATLDRRPHRRGDGRPRSAPGRAAVPVGRDGSRHQLTSAGLDCRDRRRTRRHGGGQPRVVPQRVRREPTWTRRSTGSRPRQTPATTSRTPRPHSPNATGTPSDEGGLAVPTWLYGHEPANLFAGAIAKYFSNAIREDTLLRLARGGMVFAPGWAGTVQEVFQAATKAFYRTDGDSGPLVFLDRALLDRYGAGRQPARPAARGVTPR